MQRIEVEAIEREAEIGWHSTLTSRRLFNRRFSEVALKEFTRSSEHTTFGSLIIGGSGSGRGSAIEELHYFTEHAEYPGALLAYSGGSFYKSLARHLLAREGMLHSYGEYDNQVPEDTFKDMLHQWYQEFTTDDERVNALWGICEPERRYDPPLTTALFTPSVNGTAPLVARDGDVRMIINMAITKDLKQLADQPWVGPVPSVVPYRRDLVTRYGKPLIITREGRSQNECLESFEGAGIQNMSTFLFVSSTDTAAQIQSQDHYIAPVEDGKIQPRIAHTIEKRNRLETEDPDDPMLTLQDVAHDDRIFLHDLIPPGSIPYSMVLGERIPNATNWAAGLYKAGMDTARGKVIIVDIDKFDAGPLEAAKKIIPRAMLAVLHGTMIAAFYRNANGEVKIPEHVDRWYEKKAKVF